MISKIAKNKKLDVAENNSEEVSEGTKEKLSSDVLVIAQEVKIIKALASNDLSQRTKQLKKLRRWLTLRANSSFPFTEEDFLRIWKGLYYMMWMSDKPLVQEELAEDLGKLIDCFTDVKTGVQFFGAFLKTMCREWFGVDQWRMDKFLMLIRRMVRYMFHALKKDEWAAASIKEFNSHIFNSVLAESASGGITMHFLDVFFEELAKVSEGEVTAKTVGLFVKPFVRFMTRQHDFKLLGYCRNRVFHHLLYQSELGREYSEKYNAWKEMGFPTASIDDLEKVETSDAEAEEEVEEKPDKKVLDPRAGNVDAFIPMLPLDAKYVIKEIESVIFKEETSTRCRKLLNDILQKYQVYQSGKFPLGVKTMPKPNLKSDKPLMMSKVEALENLENNLFATTRKLKQLNRRKRRKFLASLNFDEADPDTFEQLIQNKLANITQNGTKAKKRKSSMMSWIEEDIEPEAEGETDVSPSKIQKPNEDASPKPENNANAVTPKKQTPKKREKTTDNTKAIKPTNSDENEWDKPLEDGEIEYFIPSKKIQLKTANEKLSDMVPNPFAKIAACGEKTPKHALLGKKAKKSLGSQKNLTASPYTPAKRVKIVLQRNTIQKPSEYIKQIKSSPNVPYDAQKKPTKGLLKPNAMPSPINPFYKKKIGLKLLNETV